MEKTSGKMKFVARKVIIPCSDINDSAADPLEEPVIVCTAVGTCGTPIEKQRR